MIEVETSVLGLEAYNGPFTGDHCMHLLRRTGFGVSQEEFLRFKNLGMDDCLNIILALKTAPIPPVNDYEAEIHDPNGVLPGETWVNASPVSADVELCRKFSIYRWWQNLMFSSHSSIIEKMTLFWHNHFAIQADTVKDSRFLFQNISTLREHSIGNFKTLVKAMVLDPAMLIFLNGEFNNKNSPDENFARELQELFTIGKGGSTRFTEEDVRSAAKVLTGWKAHVFKLNAYYYDTDHDKSDKTFSSFYNNTVIKGDKGEAELDALLDMIFIKEDVSEYICSRFYKWFVYYEINEDIKAKIIIPLAKIFRDNNYEILPVLRKLLSCEHFYDILNRGCQIKNPYDFCLGFTKLILNSIENKESQNFEIQTAAAINLHNTQMLAFSPPNVAGWPAYWQAPSYYQLWLNSSTIIHRKQIIYNTLNDQNSFRFNVLSFAASFKKPEDPLMLIDELCFLLFPVELESGVKDFALNILLSGQENTAYWTSAWNNYKSNPGNIINMDIVKTRLIALMQYLFLQPNYQLC